MRISDWSSNVWSSDRAELMRRGGREGAEKGTDGGALGGGDDDFGHGSLLRNVAAHLALAGGAGKPRGERLPQVAPRAPAHDHADMAGRQLQPLPSRDLAGRRHDPVRGRAYDQAGGGEPSTAPGSPAPPP